MRIFATTVFLVAFVNAAWAESALFPKSRWFAVDALNGTSLRGKGLTLFVEPEGASSAAFAKGFGGCNDCVLGSTWPETRKLVSLNLPTPREFALTNSGCKSRRTI